MITIEKFSIGTEAELWEVFHSSIRLSCIRDYSYEQVCAWAPNEFNVELWSERIQGINPFVAKFNSKIVGYADLQCDGYIDHFFVHGKYQRLGIGRELMQHILKNGSSSERLFSHVSLTAKPFFESHDFVVVSEQLVTIRGIAFVNYVMERT